MVTLCFETHQGNLNVNVPKDVVMKESLTGCACIQRWSSDGQDCLKLTMPENASMEDAILAATLWTHLTTGSLSTYLVSNRDNMHSVWKLATLFNMVNVEEMILEILSNEIKEKRWPKTLDLVQLYQYDHRVVALVTDSLDNYIRLNVPNSSYYTHEFMSAIHKDRYLLFLNGTIKNDDTHDGSGFHEAYIVGNVEHMLQDLSKSDKTASRMVARALNLNKRKRNLDVINDVAIGSPKYISFSYFVDQDTEEDDGLYAFDLDTPGQWALYKSKETRLFADDAALQEWVSHLLPNIIKDGFSTEETIIVNDSGSILYCGKDVDAKSRKFSLYMQG